MSSGYAILGVVLVAGCGQVQQMVADASAPPSDAAVDGAALDGASDAPPCTTYNGTFTTAELGFASDVGASAQVDFETRGDGVTGVTAGTPVPSTSMPRAAGSGSSSWARMPAAW